MINQTPPTCQRKSTFMFSYIVMVSSGIKYWIPYKGFCNALVISPNTMVGLFNMWEGGSPGRKFSNVTKFQNQTGVSIPTPTPKKLQNQTSIFVLSPTNILVKMGNKCSSTPTSLCVHNFFNENNWLFKYIHFWK